MKPHWIDLLSDLDKNSRVLDVGCAGFRVQQMSLEIGRSDLGHFGVDYSVPECEVPLDFELRIADLNRDDLPFGDNMFDLVVASHVIEHISDPIKFFSDAIRVLKPGGVLFLEAPSERSILLPGMFMQHELAYSLSYYDDPTHQSRPWTAQSLHRLAKCFNCEPIRVGYMTGFLPRCKAILRLFYGLVSGKGGHVEAGLWVLVGWACYGIIRKPTNLRGSPSFHYYLPSR